MLLRPDMHYVFQYTNNISSDLKHSHQLYRRGDLKSCLLDDKMLPTNYNTACNAVVLEAFNSLFWKIQKNILYLFLRCDSRSSFSVWDNECSKHFKNYILIHLNNCTQQYFLSSY
jgi:hypothetical protein